MITISAGKRYLPAISGKPRAEIEPIKPISFVAAIPESIPYIKPRLHVKVGDHVNIGSLLFTDKRRTDIRFLSPGGGTVHRIDFGPRRVIREIIIQLDAEEKQENFTPISRDDLQHVTGRDLLGRLTEGGMLPFLRSLPFRDIVDPEVAPPSIIVALSADEPFHPAADVYLAGKKQLIEYGLLALKRITDRVYVTVDQQQRRVMGDFGEMITHTLSGSYPACDPGVLLYHTRKRREDNPAWFIQGQDVLLLAQFLSTGKWPTERVVSVAGSAANTPTHFLSRMGAPVSAFIGDSIDENSIRIVAGGLFRGRKVRQASFLGLYETSLNLIPEGAEKTFLGFIRPGYGKPSSSRTFLSRLNPKDLSVDCNLHGEERACVNCSSCARICPVDILPQFTYKSLLVDEIEEALEHGLLDCVACGLCTYVCPSKIALCETFNAAKLSYYKEQARP